MRCIGGKMEALNFNSLNPLVVRYRYFFRMTLGTWGQQQQPRDLPRDGESLPPSTHCLWVWGAEAPTKNENAGDGVAILQPSSIALVPPVRFLLSPWTQDGLTASPHTRSWCHAVSWDWNDRSWCEYTFIAHHFPCPVFTALRSAEVAVTSKILNCFHCCYLVNFFRGRLF